MTLIIESAPPRTAPARTAPAKARSAPDGRRKPGRAHARGVRADQWGRAAEDVAADWYRARGGRIVARRKRTAAGEIDLVVELGEILAIVEVKARRSVEAALAAARPAQWRRLGLAAEIVADELGANDLRLDLAAVDGNGTVAVVENVGMAAPFA